MNTFPASSLVRTSPQLSPSAPVQRTDGADGRIRHAAGEFESILLNQWLESAESTFGSAPGAEEGQDADDAQLKSFAVQALAKGITAAGGIGLSGMVSRALAADPASSDDSKSALASEERIASASSTSSQR